jgi:hypothetical protein
METSTLLLVELGVLGIIYCVEYRLVYDSAKKFYKFKLISLILFVAGILVHTLGDEMALEMQFETIGHIIIMIGAIILIKQSLSLSKLAEEYGYG